MTEDIYTKAQILAEAISTSEEFIKLRQAEKVMLADTEAQQVISQFQDAQERLIELQEREEETTEEENELVAAMEEQVENNPTIASYLNAQDTFTEMLDKVNAILAAAIAGEDRACDCDDCGSDCSSGCGGNC